MENTCIYMSRPHYIWFWKYYSERRVFFKENITIKDILNGLVSHDIRHSQTDSHRSSAKFRRFSSAPGPNVTTALTVLKMAWSSPQCYLIHLTPLNHVSDVSDMMSALYYFYTYFFWAFCIFGGYLICLFIPSIILSSHKWFPFKRI